MGHLFVIILFHRIVAQTARGDNSLQPVADLCEPWLDPLESLSHSFLTATHMAFIKFQAHLQYGYRPYDGHAWVDFVTFGKEIKKIQQKPIEKTLDKKIRAKSNLLAVDEDFVRFFQ